MSCFGCYLLSWLAVGVALAVLKASAVATLPRCRILLYVKPAPSFPTMSALASPPRCRIPLYTKHPPPSCPYRPFLRPPPARLMRVLTGSRRRRRSWP